jgi:hypothetical protein
MKNFINVLKKIFLTSKKRKKKKDKKKDNDIYPMY